MRANKHRPHPRRVALLAALCLTAGGLLQGCGFELRKSADLPFATIYNGLRPGSALANEFNRLARVAGGTTLVIDRSQAEASVELINDSRQKEAVSFSPSGRPREYQLRYSLTFRVRDTDGVELLEPTIIKLRRYITASDVELLAEQLEEELLYREMQTDMVHQILRRIAAIKRDS